MLLEVALGSGSVVSARRSSASGPRPARHPSGRCTKVGCWLSGGSTVIGMRERRLAALGVVGPGAVGDLEGERVRSEVAGRPRCR